MKTLCIIPVLSLVLLSCSQTDTSTTDTNPVIDKQALCYNERACDSLNIGRYESALTYIDSALAIDPDFKAALSNKCAALIALGRLSEVEPIYKKRIFLEESNCTLRIGVGMYYDYIGKETEAKNCYREAKRILDGYRKLTPQQMTDLWLINYFCGNVRECQRIEKRLNRIAKKDKEIELALKALKYAEKNGKSGLLDSLFSPDESYDPESME